MLHTMYYSDEVRQLESFGPVDVELKDAEVKVAHQLIEALAGKFEPEKYHDTFEENLRELIKAHLEGPRGHCRGKSPRKLAPVVDLMAALKESLAQMPKKPPQRVGDSGKGSRSERGEKVGQGATPQDRCIMPCGPNYALPREEPTLFAKIARLGHSYASRLPCDILRAS